MRAMTIRNSAHPRLDHLERDLDFILGGSGLRPRRPVGLTTSHGACDVNDIFRLLFLTVYLAVEAENAALGTMGVRDKPSPRDRLGRTASLKD